MITIKCELSSFIQMVVWADQVKSVQDAPYRQGQAAETRAGSRSHPWSPVRAAPYRVGPVPAPPVTRRRARTDVTEPEPLPSEHPLWSTPGVLISPHVGGMSSAMQPRIDGVVRRQVALLLAGSEPSDVVVPRR